jgi:hypothetical protein
VIADEIRTVWPADDTLFEISKVDIMVKPEAHPILEQYNREIEANWELEHAANPALFNGEMLLHSTIDLSPEGGLSGIAHLTPYAAMLWWRKQPGRPVAEHLFSIAVPVTSDGAILAIRMGMHTANAGKVYCAGGSLDAHDILDGMADLDGNMRREMLEETGIDLNEAVSVSPFYGSRFNRAVNVFRVFQLDFSADEAVRRIYSHMEHDEEKEIAEPVIIRDDDTEDRNYAAFMRPIVRHVFSRP